MAKQASCDTCSNYVFDEEEDAYLCEVSFDEDEMAHFLLHPHFEGDEKHMTGGSLIW